MPVRILVVDDDELSREVFSLLLQGAGYIVETAESGDAALAHLQTSSTLPEVILTDLQMPGTIGDELARQLRDLCGPATILLAMSATAPDTASGSAFNGFLLKPFTPEAFTSAISGKAAHTENGWNVPDATVLDEAIYNKLAGSMRPSRLEQLYDLCLADTELRLASMRLAASNGDDVAYRREAHAIKGGCGMVGALQLQTLATSMEKHGLSDDDVASLEQIIVACERLRGMLIARDIIHNRARGVSGEDA
jgi:CheY-like chemotaxis protein